VTENSTDSPSASHGRLCIVVAALLWSTSGAFAKVLREPTVFHLNEPALHPTTISCLRGMIAGGFFLLLLRRRDLSFRPLMIPMAFFFAALNYLFVAAMSFGTSAEAILLQYTAPMWMYLVAVWWLGEPSDRRSLQSIVVGLIGVVIIVAGGWQNARLDIIGLGLGAGVCYAAVMICLRVLRDCSSTWLTVINHLAAGLLLLPFVLPFDPIPTPRQWVTLFLFGAVQMGFPYLLMARGLRSVSPQEAGTITLLEPIFNPLWAYLVAGEVPSLWTFAGGAFLLGALAWRYWPRRLPL
jgi:drug/metabolite transporter (DMT)-like permease